MTSIYFNKFWLSFSSTWVVSLIQVLSQIFVFLFISFFSYWSLIFHFLFVCPQNINQTPRSWLWNLLKFQISFTIFSMYVFKELKFLSRLFPTYLASLSLWTRFNFGSIVCSTILIRRKVEKQYTSELSYSPFVSTCLL